ncbi:hypothetical protein [Allobranchiibius sp. CTAmp26]|uniref:hypothetical protein n=1 Tax=Allobranchiibius sp. CTAmp26 TaxID=2815214 RepID=UPI001AA19B04|nr:hypothetical protein [Allobranchiibius sp. CTAmp26]MBO1756595.1 hypothetical protein [Allobranchiibius sp. CTAmp26]
MSRRIAAPLLAIALAGSAWAAAPTSAHAATAGAAGTYHPSTAARIADTHSGQGGAKGYVSRKNSVSYTVTGKNGIPSTGVSAVVVQLTAFDQHGNGAFVAYAAGSTRPAAVSFAYGGRSTQVGKVTVPVSSTGRITIAGAGMYQAHLRVDVVGWYASSSSTAAVGSLYLPSELDLTDDTRMSGSRLQPGDQLEEDLQVGFGSDDPSFQAPKLTAVDLNISALSPSGTGGLTAWNGTGGRPYVPSVEFGNRDSVSGSVIVPVTLVSSQSQDGETVATYKFVVGDFGGSTDVALSVGGLYTQGKDAFGAAYRPTAPRLAVNTATGLGITKGRLGTDSARLATLPTSAIDDSTIAVNMTTAAVAPTAGTWVAQTTDLLNTRSTSIVNTLAEATRSGTLTAQLDSSMTSDAPQVGFYNGKGSIDVQAWTYGRFDFSDFGIAGANKMSSRQLAKRILAQRPTVTIKHKVIRAH